jgi:hypothetical protein
MNRDAERFVVQADPVGRDQFDRWTITASVTPPGQDASPDLTEAEVKQLWSYQDGSVMCVGVCHRLGGPMQALVQYRLGDCSPGGLHHLREAA